MLYFNQEGAMGVLRNLWARVPLFWRLAGPGLLLALGVVALLQGRGDGRLHLYFLSVGQGNAILVVSPSGHAVLIDGGPDATALLSELGAHRPFWKPDLDLVLLTETAPERLAGPVAALERYRARAAGRPGRARPSSGWERWQALLAAQGVEAAPLQAGARFDLGDGAFLEVLFPGSAPLPQAAPGGSDDALVLRLRYGAFSALLPTAAGPAGRQTLLAGSADLSATVLLVPRQAGERSLDARFLQAVRPQLAIVSAGAGRHEGPDARTLDLLREAHIPFYRTDRQGTVEVSSDGREVEIRTEKMPENGHIYVLSRQETRSLHGACAPGQPVCTLRVSVAIGGVSVRKISTPTAGTYTQGDCPRSRPGESGALEATGHVSA